MLPWIAQECQGLNALVLAPKEPGVKTAFSHSLMNTLLNLSHTFRSGTLPQSASAAPCLLTQSIGYLFLSVPFLYASSVLLIPPLVYTVHLKINFEGTHTKMA